MQNNHTTCGYRIDMTGKVFGRLTVLEFSCNRNKRAYWICACVCGEKCIVDGAHLRSGATQSCGCYHKDRCSEVQREHGDSHSTEFNIWMGMHGRCNCVTNRNYHQYGGRGITVCERWNDYDAFLLDMGRRPSPQHSIDRIDVNGNYEPGNCRWATTKEQQQNRRNNVLVTYNGQTMCLSEWCRILGFGQGRIGARLAKGWSIDRAFTEKPRGYGGRKKGASKSQLVDLAG